MSAPDDFHRAFDPALGLGFRHDRAYWLGRCADLVYPVTDEELHADRTAREALRIERDARAWGFTRFRFWSSISTQCFVAASDTLIVVCFRGTEPTRLWDLYADLTAIPLRAKQVPGDLHLGFWTALGQVWGDTAAPPPVWPADPTPGRRMGVPDCVREFLEEPHASDSSEADPPHATHPTHPPQRKTVWITGHSLGGALATMAAARLVGEGVVRPEQIGGIYTFGQPRVGDARFAEAYALGSRHFRVVHDNDVVTQVPPESLQQAHAVVRLFLEDHPGTGKGKGTGTGKGTSDTAAVWSRFQYRHVGRLAFLSGRTGITVDITPLELLRRRLMARVDALVRTGPVRDRLFPGLSDHSMTNYGRLLAETRLLGAHGTPKAPAGRARASAAVSPERSRRLDLLAAVGGAAAGLVAGLIAGWMEVSESVAAGNVGASRIGAGSVAAGLAALLALDDRHVTHARAIAAGTFGVVSVAGMLLGTYIRSH